MLLAGPLAAHNTLFGYSPRSIWNKGLEIEGEIHWEGFRTFRHHDSIVSNPRDISVDIYSLQFALTYGLMRDLAVRGVVPFSHAVRVSKDGRDTFWGLRDMRLGFKWRMYNDPFPGGSFQGGAFWDFTLPTARMRDDTRLTGRRLSLDMDSWMLTTGLTWGYSTERHYLWWDVATMFRTLDHGRIHGPVIMFHPAYAVRVFSLTDYRDFDLILLFEADLEFADERMLGAARPDRLDYYKIHVSGGVQMNITNFVEIKFGYEYPVYQYYFRTTFTHDGEAKFSFNYLF
ncbi:MAG: hypothetical protein HS108_02540 [Planctomycetes bacterium]|nr:hypothetical protein [Planctomycetota bacterium]MCL4729204.1 hypothetical protein [Planctomycetota bacterium]